jgi:succinyl-diaminopimelate desuccinylase
LRTYRDIDGVMIGYPGNHGIIVGARGFYRATVTVRAGGGHSGGRRSGSENAIEQATQLVQALCAAPLPQPTTDAFPLVPSLTVTGIRGGTSFSMIPDRCDVDVDIRLTPDFDAGAARALLHATVRQVEKMGAERLPSSVHDADSWPAYRLSDHVPVVQALLAAARAHKPHIATVVCGPSNIGNYFAAHQIDATCGFGVTYENLHAPNEAIKLDTIEMTHAAYAAAVRVLLSPARGGRA